MNNPNQYNPNYYSYSPANGMKYNIYQNIKQLPKDKIREPYIDYKIIVGKEYTAEGTHVGYMGDKFVRLREKETRPDYPVILPIELFTTEYFSKVLGGGRRRRRTHKRSKKARKSRKTGHHH